MDNSSTALLSELGVILDNIPLILCDNLSVAYLIANPILYAQTKHVEVAQTNGY